MNFTETIEQLDKLYEKNNKGGPDLITFLRAQSNSFWKNFRTKDPQEAINKLNDWIDRLNKLKARQNEITQENARNKFISDVNAALAEAQQTLTRLSAPPPPPPEPSNWNSETPNEINRKKQYDIIKQVNMGADTDELYYFADSYESVNNIIKTGIRFVPEDSGNSYYRDAKYNSISLTTSINNVPARRVGHYSAGIILDRDGTVDRIIRRGLYTKNISYFSANIATIIAMGKNKAPYPTIVKDESNQGDFKLHILNSGEVSVPPIVYDKLKNEVLKDFLSTTKDPIQKREYSILDNGKVSYPNFIRYADNRGIPVGTNKTSRGQKITLDTVYNGLTDIIESPDGICVNNLPNYFRDRVFSKIKKYFLEQTLLNEFEYRLYFAEEKQQNFRVNDILKGIVVDIGMKNVFSAKTEEEFRTEATEYLNDTYLEAALSLWQYCKNKQLVIKYFDLSTTVLNNKDFLDYINAELTDDGKIRLKDLREAAAPDEPTLAMDNAGFSALYKAAIFKSVFDDAKKMFKQ